MDVALYAALLVMLLVALFSDGTGPIPALGTKVGVLPLWQIWTILGLLAVLGLRDKVIFLAARGEVYATLTVTFLFAGVDMIVAAKLVFLVIWMGAATSKLNKHFPFVISTMMSNNPLIRTRWLKRKFFEKFPDDLRPGRVSRLLAHFSTAIEMLVPLALFFSHGGWPTGDRGVRDGVLPPGDPVGDPDGCAAGVERVHDLRRAVRCSSPTPTSAWPT